jgi:hypothetical protein
MWSASWPMRMASPRFRDRDFLTGGAPPTPMPFHPEWLRSPHLWKPELEGESWWCAQGFATSSRSSRHTKRVDSLRGRSSRHRDRLSRRWSA